MSTLLIALILILILNYAIFLLAYKLQSDHYTDITYAFSFLLAAAYFYFSTADYSISKSFMFIMIAIWSVRLGLFLRSRAIRMGEDKRFTNIRPNFGRFFRFFTIQGFGVWLISLPFMIGFQKDMSASSSGEILQFVAAAIIVVGLVIEILADYQKNSFRNNSANDGQFMNRGLFTIIRHPNYLGEIMFWTGMFLFVSPYLIGLEWLAIISPIFITVLLNYVSGINLLEKSSLKRYGHLSTYQDYFKNSWRLIPYVY